MVKCLMYSIKSSLLRIPRGQCSQFGWQGKRLIGLREKMTRVVDIHTSSLESRITFSPSTIATISTLFLVARR